MKGFITYPTYTNLDGKTVVQLFGRLENGQSFVTQNSFSPYFFIKSSDLKKISKLLSKYTITKTKLTNFQNSPVSKISAQNQTELNKLSKTIHKKSLTSYEADVKPQYRFMIDHDLQGTVEIQGDYESSEKLDRIYYEPEISPPEKQYKPKLKIASIDIETSNQGESLYCIGIYSQNVNYVKPTSGTLGSSPSSSQLRRSQAPDIINKVFMITKHKIPGVISCNSEEDCLEKFKSALLELDPDIITGWNVINFDLVFLKSLYEKYKISFDIGRTNSQAKMRIESNFFRSSSADIPGRQVIDGLSFLRDPFIKEAPSIKNAKFESYNLEAVSQQILNKGKLLKGKGRHNEIEDLYKTNSLSSHKKLAEYNLMDCELVYKILEKTKMIDLAIERSQLTGMPIDRMTASIAAFDSLYLREARSKSLASPTTVFSNKEERIQGGFVQSTKPGIYHNVLILDFKSLYPSIIKTFNIDPASYSEKKIPNSIESPNKAYFKNSKGILPNIISKLHLAREKAKKEKRELSSYAIKIIMNSFFGVLASPNCRFYNLKMANAITHFGQFILKLTAEQIENLGYKVIYMDTDSTFVETKLAKAKANALGLKIQNQINDFYKKYTKKNYNRDSFLELEFEKQYLSMMLPQTRQGTGANQAAAKKRYAGLVEVKGPEGGEKLEITGLEAIRGDWTEAAQDFQRSLLMKTFHKEPIEKFIKSYIKKIRSGDLDPKLIYKKSLRKPLEKYTKTTPPHVKAARKLPKLESRLIKYYITTNGPEPIQKLKHPLDYNHYINKQIAPIANQILILLDKDFDELTQTSKQMKLF